VCRSIRLSAALPQVLLRAVRQIAAPKPLAGTVCDWHRAPPGPEEATTAIPFTGLIDDSCKFTV
jgi:hypothetical protein